MDKFIVSLPRGGPTLKRKDRTESPGVAKPARQSQMYIDLGQKSFGASKHCGLCGMLYVVGDVDDEKRHSVYCSKAKAGPTIATKGLSELARFNDDKDAIFELKGNKQKRSTHQQEAIDTLMGVVQEELGSEAGFVSDSDASIMLYVRDKVVLACLVSQPVHPSKLVAMSATRTSTDVNIHLPAAAAAAGVESAGSGGSNSAQTGPGPDPGTDPGSGPGAASRDHDDPLLLPPPPTSTTLGIKLIWTAAGARRQGLAGHLLDAARKSFEFGRLVRREHVAFSQPTTHGLALALAYCRRQFIWGYA